MYDTMSHLNGPELGRREVNVMGKRLYVGGLPCRTTENDLEQLFAQVGAIESVRLVFDRATGRSKGFGFVEMSTDAEAAKAVADMNGRDLDGRTLTVNEAQERSGGGGGGRSGGRSGGGRW